ncbi:MAG: hypothetical protein HFF39_09080 [Lawsonibacter sp.]|nr:hypothetical protein [Lawsonibacter sp.]
MPRGKGPAERLKDSLRKNRNRLVYVLVLASGFLGLAGWAFLPEMVSIRMGQPPTAGKNTAVLADLAVSWGFCAAFWFRPREIVYFAAACLGVFLSAAVLVINL